MAPAFTRCRPRDDGSDGSLAATVAGWQDGETRSIDSMIAPTLEVVLQALFGTTTGDDVETVRVAFSEISTGSHRSSMRWHHSHVGAYNIRFGGAASWTRSSGESWRSVGARRAGRNLLGRLIAATAAEALLDEARLADEVRTVMLAGHETTAIALTSSTARASPGAPGLGAKRSWGWTGPDADTPLPRLDAVLDETMRLHPPAPFAREPTEDIELGGHTAPGTTLMLAPFILHRSERYFDEPRLESPALDSGYDPHCPASPSTL